MMTRATCISILLVFTSLGIVDVESQAFQVIPSNTCVPCSGPTEFNCSTTAPVNLVGGGTVQGVGGQMWRIQFPDGTMATLSSNNADMVPAGYGFISPSMGVFTGLRVNDTNSTLNGTTFQCIAFIPATVGQQNDSAAAVTLEVGGPPQFSTCEFRCPSDRCTIIWERPPTVSCNLLQFNVSVTGPDGTLAYSGSFGQDITSTQTTPLNPNTTYTATITAENECGTTACSATNSTAERDGTTVSGPSSSITGATTSTSATTPSTLPTVSTTVGSGIAGPVGGAVGGVCLLLLILIAIILFLIWLKNKRDISKCGKITIIVILCLTLVGIIFVIAILIYESKTKKVSLNFPHSGDKDEDIELSKPSPDKSPPPPEETDSAPAPILYADPNTIPREEHPTTGDVYTMPDKKKKAHKPEDHLATYQDPSAISHEAAPTGELYTVPDKKKGAKKKKQQASRPTEEQLAEMYSQPDKSRKEQSRGLNYADVGFNAPSGGRVPDKPPQVFYSDVNVNVKNV